VLKKNSVVFLFLCFPIILAGCARNSARAEISPPGSAYVLAAEEPAEQPAAAVPSEQQKRVAELMKAANDPDDAARKAAIRALGEMGGPEAAEALGDLLTNPDRITRTRAILALGMAGRSGWPYLLQALENEPVPRTRMLAAGVISRVVQPGDTSAIEERFDRQDIATKMHLVIALAHIRDEESYAALSRLIESPDHLIRFYVVNCLADAPPDERALPILIKSLKDEATEVRMWGIFGLQRLNHPDSYPAVLAALNDEDAYVRKEAAFALGLLGNKEAVPFLKASLKDPTTIVRADAAAALGMLGDRTAVDELRPLLKESNPAVQIKTAEALARLGEYDGMDTLVALVGSSQKLYAMEARQALVNISNEDFGYNRDAWQNWWAGARDTMENAHRQNVSE
jgi:HEAT repeat protein